MTENAKAWVEYTLVNGRRGQVSVETIAHISVLSDGRGVLYTKTGRVLLVRDGLKVLEHWRQAGPADQLRTPPPWCSK